MSKFAQRNNSNNNNNNNNNNNKSKNTHFFYISPGYLLIIFYQLTKFEAPICYDIWDILNTTFHSDLLKVA